MNRSAILAGAACIALLGCDGLREALSAHQDVVARAASQELTVDRLADLLAGSALPIRQDVARSVTDVWVDYHLLAKAAVEGDSLNSPEDIDAAMWAELARMRAERWMDSLSVRWSEPDSATASVYNQGNLLAAQHILIRNPTTGAPATSSDSVRRLAESIRARTTDANFAALAREYSQDPGSAPNGGRLGVFPRGMMVPEFEQALLALRPGEISPLVQSQFGYHIIRRLTYDEAGEEFAAAYRQGHAQAAESTYVANLEAGANITVDEDAVERVRSIAADPDAFRDESDALATWDEGELTAGKMARWLGTLPPQARIAEQIGEAPDSVVHAFVESVVRNELIIAQADSAGVTVDTQQIGAIRTAYSSAIIAAWNQLGIAPDQLADSAATESAMLALASERIANYLDRLVVSEARFIPVPPQLQSVLHDRYEYRINPAGLDRALETATALRAQADSARPPQPPSQVPLPQGVPSPGVPSQGVPQGAPSQGGAPENAPAGAPAP